MRAERHLATLDILDRRLLNCNNFAGSLPLAEVSTLLSATLVLYLSHSILNIPESAVRAETAADIRAPGKDGETPGRESKRRFGAR